MTRLAFALLLFAAAAPVRPAVACPTSELLLGGSTILTPEAQFDSVLTSGGVVVARAGYDLVAGWLAMKHPGSLGHTTVLARDVFEASGPAPGSPVSARLEFTVDGMISTAGCGGSGCYGDVGIGIHTAAGSRDTVVAMHMYAAEVRPFRAVIELPITFVAGQAMALEFRLEGWRAPGGSHASEGFGTYRFLDLPEGATIASCQGFVGPATPTRPASWGRVKAAYR